MAKAVDITGIVKTVSDSKEDQEQLVSVHVYYDQSATEPLKEAIALSLTPHTSHACVLYSDVSSDAPMPHPATDFAVIVAGTSVQVGQLYQDVRESGTPAVVVTDMPSVLERITSVANTPLDVGDVVSPAVGETQEFEEPLYLDEESVVRVCDRLGTWISSLYPDKRTAFALAFPFFRHSLAVDAIGATAFQNAAIAAIPLIPGADMPLMTLNQVKMVLQIASAYGMDMGFERVKEVAAIVGAGFLSRGLARFLPGAVPVLGAVVRGGIGYGTTYVVGRGAIEYYENGADPVGFGMNLVEKAKGLALKVQGTSPEEYLNKVYAQADNAKDVLQNNVIPTVQTYVIPTVMEVKDVVANSNGSAKDTLKNVMAVDGVSQVVSKTAEFGTSVALGAVAGKLKR